MRLCVHTLRPLSIVFLLLLTMVSLMWAGEPPGGEEPCCPDGHSPQPTHTGLVEPKEGEPYSEEFGVMTELRIHNSSEDVTGETRYYEWTSSGMDVDHCLQGGQDSDVCVSDADPDTEYCPYDADTTVTWGGDAPGFEDPNNERHYFVTGVQLPGDGDVDTYTLMGTADDTGRCNAGDEQREASTTVAFYYPYRTGAPPNGTINDKPGSTFITVPTWRFPDQLLNSGGAMSAFSAFTWDDDEIESDVHDPPPGPAVLWNDGTADDWPIDAEVEWTSFTGESDYGHVVTFHMPLGGSAGPVTWIVSLSSVDDDGGYDFADDPESTDVDSVTHRVYRDHLVRDISNVGPLNANIESVCWQAANHAWNGSGGSAVPPWSSGPAPVTIYEAPSDPEDDPTVALDLSGVSRRDFLQITGYLNHGVTSTDGSAGGVWEYNGLSGPDFGTQTIQACVDELTASGERKVHRVVLHPHPYCDLWKECVPLSAPEGRHINSPGRSPGGPRNPARQAPDGAK